MGKYLDSTGVSHLIAKCKAAFAAITHTHSASDVTSGALPLARGGTGISTSSAYNLLNTLFYDATEEDGALYLNDSSNLQVGTLPINRGGTGATGASVARSNLGAQETLVSGTNIKTINNESLLGSGNISISGGGSIDFGAEWDAEALYRAEGAGDYGAMWIDDDEVVKVGGPLPIAYGGTGANNAASARTNIGAVARVPGSTAELPNCTATSNVFPIVLGNSFANNGEISYMSPANFRNMIGAAMYDFYQATGASGTISTTAGTITPITLVTTGAVSNGSGFSISGGGIKVANAGKYRVTASIYILGTNATFKGVYVKKNNNSAGTTGELFGLHYPYTASGIQVGPKVVSLAANDVLYLCGRMGGVAGTIYTDNKQTFLLVERIV